MKTTNRDVERVDESVHKINDLIGEISEASREQSQGIDQVNHAVSELGPEVQLNAASAEESAAAARQMNSQAEVMKTTAERLIRMVGAQAGRRHRSGPGKHRRSLRRFLGLPPVDPAESGVDNAGASKPGAQGHGRKAANG